MFILARGGETYARLSFHVGPGGSLLIPVSVDYSRPFAASDHAAWTEEYYANVVIDDSSTLAAFDSASTWESSVLGRSEPDEDDWFFDWEDVLTDARRPHVKKEEPAHGQ